MSINKRMSVIYLLCLSICTTSYAQEAWELMGTMQGGRYFFEAQPISRTEILVMGGNGTSSGTCDIIDCASKTINPGPKMKYPRAQFASLVRHNGNVLAVGGDTELAFSTIEEFDINTRQWKLVCQMSRKLYQHQAVLIDNRYVLAVGGRASDGIDNCEICDLETGISTRVSKFPYLTSFSQMWVLKDGTVIAFAGRSGGPGSYRTETIHYYNRALDRWGFWGTTGEVLYYPTVVEDNLHGLVWTGGSYKESANGGTFATTVAVLKGNEFVKIGDLEKPRAGHGLVIIEPNLAMVVGGLSNSAGAYYECEFVNLITGVSTPAPRLNVSRSYFKTLLSRNEKNERVVVAIGGTGQSGVNNSVEFLELKCDGGSAISVIDASAANYTTAGVANTVDKRIRLTDTATYSSGAAWARSKISVKDGFDVRFSFTLSKGNDRAQPDNGPPGADGVALVFLAQKPSAVGASGRGMGYEGLPSGLAVEFDAYINAEYGDQGTSHIAVQKGDGQNLSSKHHAPYMLGMTNAGVPPFIANGKVYHARVVLGANRIKVFCDTSGRFTEPILTIDNVDISSILGNSSNDGAYMGITSATGISVQRHEILSWEVSGCNALISDVFEGVTPAETGYSVYPSPAADQATLSLPYLEEPTMISIFSANGEMVFNTVASAFSREVQLQATDFTNGVYVIVCRTGTQTNTVKWLVQH